MKINPRFGSRRGNAMIEFAIAATLLTSIFTGVFQFGYSMYRYNELVSAVRAGVRYASVLKISNSGNSTLSSAYTDAVKNMVVYGNPSPGNSPTPLISGLGTGNVTVSATFDTGGQHVPTYVTVKVNSFSVDAVFKTYTFTNKPTLTMPFLGLYCSSSGGNTC